jgi:hypothetical protein
MDVLTDVLQTVRARAACSGRLEAHAPWGIALDEGEEARFHVVLEGRLWLRTGDGEVIQLERGDLVALPHGDAHALVDSPTSPTRPLGEVLCERRERGPIRVGGDGARASLWSGRIEFEDRRGNPLLSVLPRLFIGPVAWLAWRGLKRWPVAGLIAAGVAGSLTNTILVLGMIGVMGLLPWAALGPIAIANGLPEALVSTLIVLAVGGVWFGVRVRRKQGANI